jgi:iron-sulfur cluster assembly protein
MNPVTITDAAAPGGIGFRLSIKKTGCSGYAYVPAIIEKEIAGDINFTAQENLKVFVDPECLQYVQDLQVDFVTDEGQGLKQKRLVFINPKESGRCGCGESFTIE